MSSLLLPKHKRRPPSASHPAPARGGGGRGRRRPRSAFAATTLTQRQPLSAKDTPGRATQRKEQRKRHVHVSPAATHPTRPASANAAAVGRAKARPLPVRPSRRRPVTAIGAVGSSAKGGYGNKTTTDTHGTASTDAGLGFYHEHENLGADPEVMRRATEYVSKILNADKKEGCGQETTSSPQPRPPPNSGSLLPGDARPEQNTSSATPKNSEKYHKARLPGRGQRRKRPHTVAAVTAATGGYAAHLTSRTKRAPPKRTTASGAENGVDHSTPDKQHHQSDEPHSTTHAPASSCDFPFPSGGSGQDVNDSSLAAGIEEDNRNASSENTRKVNGVGGTARCEVDDDSRNDRENHGPCSSRMTPMAFDVFCSMRPTLSKDTGRAKQSRPASNARGGAGMSGKERSDSNGEGMGHQRWSSSALRYGELEERTAASAWTSVFGAVCAGAERGRVRAEVLKAARREVSRLKRKRKCSAAATPGAGAGAGAGAGSGGAAASAPSAQHEPTSNKLAHANSTEGDRPWDEVRSADAAKACALDMVDNQQQLDSENGFADANALCGQSDDGIQGDNKHHHAEDPIERITADADNTERSLDAVYRESHKLSPSGRPRMPESTSADNPPRQPRVGWSTSPPLFRHPFGGGTTCIAVNAPRSLQVCPGDYGFCGVGSRASRRLFNPPETQSSVHGHRLASSRRSRRRSPDRSPTRRPSTASGTACRGTLVTGNEAGGGGRENYRANVGGGLERGERPETAWSFFSKEKSKGKRGGARFSLSEER